MNELIEKAHAKMMEEMSEERPRSEDIIHNWLCQQVQVDNELLEGILKEGKSIRKAMQYCYSQAMKQAIGGCALIIHDDVFQWVTDYFKSEEVEIKQPKMSATNPLVTVSKQCEKENHVPKKETKSPEGEQLSLLDFL
ncbi:hypothetical protein IGJ83_003371 [Enterococcus pernyi]